MSKKETLQKLFKKLTSPEDKVNKIFDEFDKEIETFKKDFKDDLWEKANDKVSIKPVIRAIDSMKEDFIDKFSKIKEEFDNKIDGIEIPDNSEDIESLRLEVLTLIDSKSNDLNELKSNLIENISSVSLKIEESNKFILNKIPEVKDPFPSIDELKNELDSLSKTLGKDKTELIEMMSRGGSQNQQIRVNGTVATSRYADINLISGGATVSTNNTLKRTDITLPSGGGGITTISGGTIGTAGFSSDIMSDYWFDGIIANFVQNAVGDFSITFTSTQADLFYVIHITSGSDVTPDDTNTLIPFIYVKTTSGFSFYTVNYKGSAVDPKFLNISVSRTLTYS